MLKGRRFALFLLLPGYTLVLLSPLRAQQTAEIVVRTAETLGPVNHLVFGQNIDAADAAHIFSSETTDLNLIQRGDGFWDPAKMQPVPEVASEGKAVGMSLLRYPGGCLVHNFDWRKTVGPDAKRSGWLFGLDEYLSLCSSIGAVPLITVSDYALPAEEMPQNAAGLVEYVNSPADARHPWAMKRMEWGHPSPYKVIWFELGNESMHGNHRLLPRRQYTAEQYAAYVNATAAAMRRVDSNIKIGIVTVPGSGTDVNSDWNRTVVHLAGASADFVVIHMYAPSEPSTDIPGDLRVQSMMVAPQHVEQRLIEYHRMIQQQLGHDLPLAITEFNGALDESNKAYRFSLGDALESADLLRVFLKPELNVALSSYWNFLNGAFGMVQTSPGSATGNGGASVQPAFLMYQLWAQHFGSKLVKLEVQSPRADFAGAGSETAARGDTPEPKRLMQRIDVNKYSSTVGALWPRLLNVQIQQQNSDWTIHIKDLKRSIYPTLARIPRPEAELGAQVEFSLSFDAKFTPDPGTDTAAMGIGLMDSRGWNQTHSGIGVDSVTTEWKHFDATYRLATQTPSIDLTARLIAEGKHVSGTLQVRNLSVASFAAEHDAAYSLLTSAASSSTDGKTIYLIVINKSASDSIPTAIRLPGFAAAGARYWEINGPSLESTTGVIQTKDNAALPLKNAAAATHVFPAHSMTAIAFRSSR